MPLSTPTGSARQGRWRSEPRKDNTSGYLGVSWSKAANKWGAYVRRDGVRHYLGLFDSAEKARDAYLEADAILRKDEPDPRSVLLDMVRSLYATHGPEALGSPFLDKAGVTVQRLRRVGLRHADLLNELGLAEEYARWRATEFNYAGKRRPRWTWEIAVATAIELKEREGDLPTVQWCRLNGHGPLTNFVSRQGRTWEDLRSDIGLPASSKFFESRTGVRWRSRPEASFSNFLYARGIEHKRGERYASEYAERSGRRRGQYDVHFHALSGDWINVEIWGDIPDSWSHGRYSVTRKFKEDYHADDPTFLGIQYQDCLIEDRLTAILEPYIGIIDPFQFDKPQDRIIETAHWSDADELLETCRELAAQMPDGIFPGDEWLRRRGRYKDRPGPAYATLATRVSVWLGGTRQARQLLGQAHASTTSWTPESVIAAWREFERAHGVTPSQVGSPMWRATLPLSVVREGQRIRGVAQRLGVTGKARQARRAGVKWTPERAIKAWRDFERDHSVSPSQAMGVKYRAILPRSVAKDGANIYNAANRLGVIAEAKAGNGRSLASRTRGS